MIKNNRRPRDGRGSELRGLVRYAKTQAGGRAVLFEVMVAERCVIVTRGADGDYHHALTRDFDRCGARTRELSIRAAEEAAATHYEEKGLIIGKPETYGQEAERFYVVEVWGGIEPGQHEGPFKTEEEYAAAARRAHRGLDEGSILLLARVTASGFELTSFRAGFFEEGEREDKVAA